MALRRGELVRGVYLAGMFLVAGAVAGCATTDAQIQSPAAPAAAVASQDRSCQGLRSEIMKLEGRGVARLVDRQHEGSKLTPSQKADVDSYNALLNEYLGARCHLN